MTGKRISLALAVATLLFVGAGCSADQHITTDTSSTPPSRQQPQPEDTKPGAAANVNAAVKVDVPTSIDASIDAIIKDGSDETEAQKDIEKDASDVDADNASAKAFGTASYDTETK